MVTPGLGWLIASAVVGCIVAGAVTTWVLVTRPTPFEGDDDSVAEHPQTSFEISGDLAEPVFPGGSAPLDLRISNPLDTDLVVSDVRVEVQDVDAPRSSESLPCDVADFAVEQLSETEDLVVRAGATASLSDLGVAAENLPRVLMLDTSRNQDGCKSASFTLAFSAVGRIGE